MISPEDIHIRARRLWATGQPLRALLETAPREPFFPYLVPFRKPTAQEWLDSFAELRAATENLHVGSKAHRGVGYSVEFRETSHQKLGRLRVPERVTIDSIEDLADCAGETVALQKLRALAETLQSREPRLLTWLAKRPFTALECEADFERLLDTAAHFQAHPRPQCFARELGVPGVDSKFIEANRSVLSEWLDLLLPQGAINASVRGLSDRGFERRYGLRFEEPEIRFRWLDAERALAERITDATVPLSEFASYAPHCEHVIVTENKINFLTLPARRNTLAIFGSGYAVDLLKSVTWLDRQPLHYWGDLDTHGFAILSRLRGHWPYTQSFLMDRETLLAHRSLWTEEPVDSRCLRELSALDEQEQALYDDLRFDRLGSCVRLEQERILFGCVKVAIEGLRS